MSDTPRHIASTDSRQPSPRKGRGGALRVLRIIALSVLGVVVLVVALLGGLTLYLSDGHLTEIVNRRASEYFYADVDARRCSFTLWSTFPRLCVEIDTLHIVSRTMRGAAGVESLPGDADSLASLRSMHAAVNIPALLAGRVELHDVQADGLHVNLVTLNDSVNNFAIVPDTGSEPFRIPYITADSIRLTNVEDITFYSAPDTLRARATIDGAHLVRRGRSRDYSLLLRGGISARLDSINLVDNLPFMFGGDVHFAFNPLAISFRDMHVNLANTESRVTMGMNLGDRSGIDQFRTEVSAFDVMKLLAWLPSEFVPRLQGLTTDMRTRLSIRLTEPYRFSDAGLPSFVAELTIPSSRITYTLDSGERYTAEDVTLRARLTFDGHDWRASHCTIDELRARGEGLSLLLSGNIADVFTDPRFAADVHVEVDAAAMSGAIPSLAQMRPQGRGTVDASVNFPVSMLISPQYASIPVTATVNVNDMSVTLPDGTVMAVASARGEVANGGAAGMAGHVAVGGFNARMEDGLSVSAPVINLYAAGSPEDMSLRGEVPSAACRIPSKSVSADATGITAAVTPSNIRLDVAKLHLVTPEGDVSASSLNADVEPQSTHFDITAASADATLTGDRHAHAKKVTARADGLNDWHFASSLLDWSMPDFGAPDRRFTANISDLRGAVALAGSKLAHLSLNIPSGTVHTAAYDAPVSVRGLSADMARLDSITLHSLSLRSGLTGVDMSGTFRIDRRQGRNYYSGHADIDFDTLHFNQIAHTIEHSSLYHGNDPGVDPKDSLATPRVHGAFVVPDNIDVTADIRADATVYTNLWLTDLGARLSMHPGRLALDTVYLSANFGHAQLAAHYLSPSADSIKIDVGAHMQDFDLTEFFKSYPNVLAMMPEMGNLHGLFHADAVLATRIFPDMEVNTGSMIADVSASATDLYLHQNAFIHRIARMALIFEDGDIHIPAIHARARVYDHLLTVEPFDIHIGKYDLIAAGRNDFAGHLYYHVGVLHNPLLPIKFGIDIKGMYHHPQIRFARSRFNEKASEGINGVDASLHINLVDELHHYGLLLLHHAAKSHILRNE